MALSEEKIRFYVRRLMLSRMRILCTNGFYGLLLMHMIYSVDEKCETACTDGERIYFGPAFLDDLSDRELDFVMMHEIMHVVLQHCRRQGKRNQELFNIACDIVVNSNILLSNEMDLRSITLKEYGESMHYAPNGKEGHEYTAEEVYAMLLNSKRYNPGNSATPADAQSNGSGNGSGNANGQGETGRKGEKSGKGHGKGEGANRQAGSGGSFQSGRVLQVQGRAGSASATTWDDHTRWGMLEEDDMLRDVWVKRFEDACEAISIQDPTNSRGLMPAFAKRIWDELRKPQTDWRSILNNFVQDEVNDYSFSPPDRRYEDSPFFLPDFNEKDDIASDILFMVDTSASITDEMIAVAYSEIKGAIEQFDGKLKGWLGFFDAAIIEPKPFEDVSDLRKIKPAGGGGTDFQIIFEYVHRHMAEKPPSSIIILTDGYAPFPQEKLAHSIPVLWLLNNDKVTPPWGKVARVQV